MIQKNELDKILNGDGLKNLWKRCFQLIKYVTGDVDESKGSIQEQIDGKLDASDIKDVKVDFTSNDTENVTQMPTLPQIKSGSKLSDQLSAISDFCKGVRYLGRLIGSADISEIGDGTDIGTITGAISKLNSDLNTNLNDKIPSQFPTTFKTRCPLGGNGLYYGQSFNVVLPYFLQSSKVTLTLTSALCGTASEPGIECIDKTYFVIEPLVSLKTVNGLEFAQVGGLGRIESNEYTHIVLTFEVSVSE